MAEIHEMAESLGRALGSTPEYRTLARALESTDEDREIVTLKNEVRQLEASLKASLQRGEEPAGVELERYEAALAKLEASSVYQSLVAAQANFDRIMMKVDAAMKRGMRKGAASRIILSS